MEEIFSSLYEKIKANQLKAFNYSRGIDLALCFNFIEIPDTKYSVMTLSVVSGKKKWAALNMSEFGRFMSKIDLKVDRLSEEFDTDYPYFTSLRKALKPREEKMWNKQLCCHKSFLIPTELVFAVVSEFSTDSFKSMISEYGGFNELVIYVSTQNHNLKISHFSK